MEVWFTCFAVAGWTLAALQGMAVYLAVQDLKAAREALRRVNASLHS